MIRTAGKWRWTRRAVVPGIALALCASDAAAQTPRPRPLSIAEALRLGAAASEEVVIARAGITRSRGSFLRARSGGRPQVGGFATYVRTLEDPFAVSGVETDSAAVPPPYCRGVFAPAPEAPVEERLLRMERRLACPTTVVPFDAFTFDLVNTYSVGLSLDWAVFTGGRVRAQTRSARAEREIAVIALSSAEAQNQLDVTQAYFDALLSDQLLRIAEATLEQAEQTLRFTELGARVGQQAEFEVLRARVDRDNLRPPVIQRRAARDVAYDRLLILLDLPRDLALELTTPLDGERPPVTTPDSAAGRAPVRQAVQQVAAQRAQLAAARAQRLPTVSLSSQYGRVAFPGEVFPGLDEFRQDWTVGASLQVPIFTGGRIRGEVLTAEAGVLEARARLEQVRELAELDTRSAYAELEAARATWEAGAGTVELAERAYRIAELRYREGISTQLELTDVRVLLEQARTRNASAARDLQVALARVDLLPALPLPAGGIGAQTRSAAPSDAGAAPPVQSGRQGTTGRPGAGAPRGGTGAPLQDSP